MQSHGHAIEHSVVRRMRREFPSLVGSSMMRPCNHLRSLVVTSTCDIQAEIMLLESDGSIAVDLPSLVGTSMSSPLDDSISFVWSITHVENLSTLDAGDETFAVNLEFLIVSSSIVLPDNEISSIRS